MCSRPMVTMAFEASVTTKLKEKMAVEAMELIDISAKEMADMRQS